MISVYYGAYIFVIYHKIHNDDSIETDRVTSCKPNYCIYVIVMNPKQFCL